MSSSRRSAFGLIVADFTVSRVGTHFAWGLGVGPRFLKVDTSKKERAKDAVSTEPASEVRRISRHEELLVVRGWVTLGWSAGSTQRVSIVRRAVGDGPRRLTRAEFAAVQAVALGAGVKQAAATLGIEWSTARTRISRALRKLELRSSSQLPGLWHALMSECTSSRADDGTELLIFEAPCSTSGLAPFLTNAENDLLQAVLTGLDTREIARRRNTSARTVANQLGTLFRKFRASTKAELASRVLQLGTDRTR